MASELGKRVAVAAIGIPVALGIIYLGGWALAVLLAVIAALGAREYYRLARTRGVLPLEGIGAAGAAAFVLLAPAVPGFGALHWFATLFFVLFVSAAAIWLRGVEGRPLESAATTITGALLAGATLSFAWALRDLPGSLDHPRPALAGSALLAFPLAVTWINDTLAYFGGRALGRHKLIPRVSPGKTVEGAISGLAGGVLAAVLWSGVVLRAVEIEVPTAAAVLAGIGLAVAAQIGDLAESLLKRDAGVKDSGALLPGHGGVLDRFDALYFTIPIAYVFFLMVLGRGAA